MSQSHKNPERVAAGLKGTINNPNTSQEAKHSASDRLHDMGGEVDTQTRSSAGTGDAHTNHVLGGYKATLKNDNASEEAKDHARKVLDDHDASYEPLPQSQRNENPDPERVKAGYKATLHNPRVSDEAKRSAEQYLEENDD